MSTPEITSTSGAGFATNPAFRALLTAASGATGADLDAVVEEIKDLELLVAPDAGGEPAALAAYLRIDGFAVEIEYLAVAPALQSQGLATALVRRIQADEAAMVVARTDDDAIGFYRVAGFHAGDSPPDSRWPGRRRYLCVLPHLPLLRNPQSDDGGVEWIHGEPSPAPVHVVPASPHWAGDFDALAGRLRDALGSRALALEHLGSTSVPGLWAKPVIDVVLTVEDPDLEDHYVPLLEAAGFVFRLRERSWYGHRLLVSGPGSGLPAANIHVFAPGCPETARMLAFRQWLRTHPADLDAYARIKRASAERINERGGGAGLVMDYNRAKEPFIHGLYARILQGHPGPGER
jgi:GrpB-like predicted nucleotidyltransferase (UPF0157 family)/GNAT superfamily N-acetyltransferase